MIIFVFLANWMSWRYWSFPSGANDNHGGAGGKPDSRVRTMMGTVGGEPYGLQRQRNHSFDTDFADAYKVIG